MATHVYSGIYIIWTIINLFNVHYVFEFHINTIDCSNLLIYSKQSIIRFNVHGLESESYFPNTLSQVLH